MKVIDRRPLDVMPFDRLIDWVDDDGIERQHWIHATGYEYFNGEEWKPEFIFPDGSIG